MDVEYTVGALTKALKKVKQSRKKMDSKPKNPLKELFSVSSPVVKGTTPFKKGKKTETSDITCDTEKEENRINTNKRKLNVTDDDEYSEGLLQPRKKRHRKIMRTVDRDEDKERRTIFIGNLPNTINHKKVLKLLKKYGEVESLRFRSLAVADPEMPKKLAVIKRDLHPGRHNMNAYARFKLEENAKDALALNSTTIKGFQLRVDMASGKQQHDHKKSVFLGNLPFNIEEDSIRTHFEDCGAINNVRVIRDAYTGIGKGFGYITFETFDGVELALKLNGKQLGGRRIRVSRSQHQNKEIKVKAGGRRPLSHPRNYKPDARRINAKLTKNPQDLKRNSRNAKARLRKAKPNTGERNKTKNKMVE